MEAFIFSRWLFNIPTPSYMFLKCDSRSSYQNVGFHCIWAVDCGCFKSLNSKVWWDDFMLLLRLGFLGDAVDPGHPLRTLVLAGHSPLCEEAQTCPHTQGGSCQEVLQAPGSS